MQPSFAQTRLSDPQYCTLYSRLSSNGVPITLRSPDFQADHFCTGVSPSILSRTASASPNELQISVPTLGLRPYLVGFLERLTATIALDFSTYGDAALPTIVVASNGPSDPATLRRIIDEFIVSKKHRVQLSLIRTETPGKSNAVNLLHQFASTQTTNLLVYVDDDVEIAPGALQKAYQELRDGSPRFIGFRSSPLQPTSDGRVHHDVFNMTVAKRRLMGWPAPIGRFNAMPLSIFPTITRFDFYDDVYLSAFFFINNVPQYVLEHDDSKYKCSNSLYEFVKRTWRVQFSDERVVQYIPPPHRDVFVKRMIRPPHSPFATDMDKAWSRVTTHLVEFAANHGFLEESDSCLNETDPTSKCGEPSSFDGRKNSVLRDELERLKGIFGLSFFSSDG